MKKRAFLAFAVILCALFAISVYSQEEVAEEEELAEEEVVLEEESVVAEESGGIAPDSPLYVIDTFVDDILIATKRGSDKTEAAIKVKNERIAEAASMVNKQNSDAAISALGNAEKTGKLIEKNKFSPSLAGETEESVKKSIATLEAIKAKLPPGGLEGVEKAINAQLTQEEKIRAAKDFIKTIGDYCEALAYEDFELMQEDETCKEEKAPDWLKEYIDEDLKGREDEARKMIVEQVTTCVLSPRECDCNSIPVKRHRYECEVNKDLAVKCEYENDFDACNELSKKKPEPPDDMPSALRPIFESTLKNAIAKKEKEMFEKLRPPECSQVSTPKECYGVMKSIYGTPPECEGLSDDECVEKMKGSGPGGPGERHEIPPECKEAGTTTPIDCAKLMIEKYGEPQWCEGLSLDECAKESMKHGKGESSQKGDFPQECKEAGATKPRDCFDIMMQKYGTPPECEGLSSDECFKEQMRHGPREREPQEFMGKAPPGCEGLEPDECFKKMAEEGKIPECKGLSFEECKEKMMKPGFGPEKKGMIPPECEGLSADDCFNKMKDNYGVPDECRELEKDECEELMRSRGNIGRPGNMPVECEGLEPDECFEKMAEEGKIQECQGISADECRQSMEKRGNEIRHEYKERRSEEREFDEDKGFRMPPECEGLNKDECMKMIQERRDSGENDKDFRRMDDRKEDMKEGREGFRDDFRNRDFRQEHQGSGPGNAGMPPECQGLDAEQCKQNMMQRQKMDARGGTGGSGQGHEGSAPPRQSPFPEDAEAQQPHKDGTPQNDGARNDMPPFRQPMQPIQPSEPMQREGFGTPEDIRQEFNNIVGQIIRAFG